MIFKLFSPKNLAKILAKILAFCTQTTATFCKNLTITLAFEKNANFLRRKLAKNAENWDHNIDLRYVRLFVLCLELHQIPIRNGGRVLPAPHS
jgi:hypothetical protein